MFSALAALLLAPALLHHPSVSRDRIAFSYGGDLWTVARAGGEAHRVTSDAGVETDPFFSPDGTLIAFTGEYDGSDDVFVVPAEGGTPKRLTTYPGSDQVMGWTPDGTRVIFRSARANHARGTRLFTVPLSGGFPEQLPLPMAFEGSLSPDGARIAYVPFSNFGGNAQYQRGLKHYRGGTASPVWIAKLADSTLEKIPRTDSNDSSPMWVGGKIYFLSDRNGPVELFSYDVASRELKPAVAGDGQDIKAATAGPGAIVYEELGSIHLLDLASGVQHPVDITVTGDFPAARPHFEPASGQIQSANVSPSGARAVFEAHGEIFTVPVEKGDIRNLSRSPAAADRDPAWSPDGKWIAWLSDAGGEYSLVLRAQDGLGETKRIDLGSPSFFYGPTWSPDSKKIAYTDKRINLWYVDIATGKPVKVDTGTYDSGPGDGFNEAWSPDGKWLAYTKQLPTGLFAVFLYSLEAKQTHAVTDGMSDAAFAQFDRSGRYLYFTASTDDGPAVASSMGAFKVPVSRSGYLVVLRKDLKSPLAPQSDEEKVKDASAPAGDAAKKTAVVEECSGDDAADAPAPEKDKKEAKDGKDAKKEPDTVKIDFEGIDQRILALPFPARNYSGVLAAKTHILYLLESAAFDDGHGNDRRSLHKFDLCSGKTEKVADDIGGFVISANAEKALYEQLPPRDPKSPDGGPHSGSWAIKPLAGIGKPGEPGKPDGTLKIDSMQVWVDPHAEWNQMFRETLRIERDFFYDPNFHGADLKALGAQYQPYVDSLVSRADLTWLMADMLGELTAQHVYLGGGEMPESRHVSGGLLGADYTIANGRYRFSHILHGENWTPELRAPLTEPGVDVHEGDYLLAVNGRDVKGSDEIYAFFQETAGKSVTLTVGADPAGKGSRTATVVPIRDERGLRLHEWIDHNRHEVERLSGGRVAYVYLPDTAAGGYTNFNRYYFPQSDKQAAIVDERFNAGGWIADYIIDWLARPRLMSAMTREGHDNDVPQTIFGPKVMLINEEAGSGGDALPWMFRRQHIGPLIGTRTWGGLIGIGGYPSLIDGGFVTAPRWGGYNPDTGEFDIENKGVAPDIEVDLDPASWRQGKDPQLEKGVEVVLELLKKNPPPATKRPKYPVYDWRAVRSAAAKH